MNTLLITRGLPGCGKSTKAKKWVAADPSNRVRVNRDDIRAMVNDSVFIKGETEKTMIAIRDAAINAALGQNKDVVCDDTNLPQRTARDLKKIADRAGAEFKVIDMSQVPVEECIKNDLGRDDKPPVGEEVIRDMYTRFIKPLKGHSMPYPEEEPDTTEIVPYKASQTLPQVWLCDIDGTVALMCGRSPFDETRVHEDIQNESVVDIIHTLIRSSQRVIFLSARTHGCYDATLEWLKKNVVPDDHHDDIRLIMRPVGDMRKDRIVKLELFDKHIRDEYNVRGVFDDRKQVCDMWRELGLTVFQVAEGDF